MAGIFDSLFSDNPNDAAYLALASGLLGGKGSFNSILGNSLAGAQGAYSGAADRGLKNQMTKMQIEEMARKLKEAQAQKSRTEEAASMFPQTQVAQGPPDIGGKYPMVQPTEQDYLNYAVKAYPLDPQLAQFGWKAGESMASREDKQSSARELLSQQLAARKEQQAASDAAKMERLKEQNAAEERLKKMLLAMRPQKDEPAPTITTITDPTDPTKMIAINARIYRGGGNGAPGVIGVSGKEPSAALREDKVKKGQDQALGILDDMRAAYDNLDRMKAIPSTERGTLSNVTAGIAATGIGQLGGRMLGTKEQVERDVIKSSRLQLLNAIKQSTGMSAQQLNSNMELKSWLDAITDPSQSKESADRILDNIEKFIASSGKHSERTPKEEKKPELPTADAIDAELKRRLGAK